MAKKSRGFAENVTDTLFSRGEWCDAYSPKARLALINEVVTNRWSHLLRCIISIFQKTNCYHISKRTIKRWEEEEKENFVPQESESIFIISFETNPGTNGGNNH